MSHRLTVYNSRLGHMTVCKRVVEQQATKAAQLGQTLNFSCPYPFFSEAGIHFKAVYLLAIPKKPRPQDATP